MQNNNRRPEGDFKVFAMLAEATIVRGAKERQMLVEVESCDLPIAHKLFSGKVYPMPIDMRHAVLSIDDHFRVRFDQKKDDHRPMAPNHPTEIAILCRFETAEESFYTYAWAFRADYDALKKEAKEKHEKVTAEKKENLERMSRLYKVLDSGGQKRAVGNVQDISDALKGVVPDGVTWLMFDPNGAGFKPLNEFDPVEAIPTLPAPNPFVLSSRHDYAPSGSNEAPPAENIVAMSPAFEEAGEASAEKEGGTKRKSRKAASA